MSIAGVVLLGMKSPDLVTLGYGTGATPPPPPPVVPLFTRGGAPVWWRGWPYDEDEPGEAPETVNEIIEVPETPHETPTEPEVIARAERISYVSQPRYDNVVRAARNAIAGELDMMRAEQRSRREARARVEMEVRKRVKRMKDDEEVLLLS